MNEDLQKKIKRYEQKIHVLEEENSQLAKRSEDSMLLGLVSESIQELTAESEVFENTLEKISILKTIPYATCGEFIGNRLKQIASYSSFSNQQNIGYPITVKQEVISDLSYGPIVISDGGLDFHFEKNSFSPTTYALIPFFTQTVSNGVFIFMDETAENDRLSQMLLLLCQVVGMAVTKYDNIFLLRALTNANKDLEIRVERRTRELIQTNRILEQEILERKKAEESLRRYDHIISSTKDLMSFVDKNYVYLAVNNAYLKAHAKKREEIVGKTVEELMGRKMFHERVKAKLDRVLEGEIIQYQSWFEYDGIGRRFMDVSYLPFKNEQEQVNGIVVSVHDLTERKKAEEKNAKLEGQYHQAQKVESVGRLAGGVAHDLNNLLVPILGVSELLRDNLSPNDARRESVDQILRAGRSARDLVRQLLAFSRKQTLETRAVDMNQAVKGFEKLLRRTIREDIEIKIITSTEARIVMADIGQIEQVIMNLAVNAQDAMPEGGCLTIETATTELDENYLANHQDVKPGKYTMLAVSDTGTGLDDEIREHLFEPFFSTKGEEGTGLGLATVYGIVKQHGGSIWVYSEHGKGTTFKVYLPESKDSHIEVKNERKSPRELKGSETILIVEDNDQVLEIARDILKRNGYTVLTAKSGPEALISLTLYSGPVHLVLTDVVMPEMNGKELYQKIAKRYDNLKVLYMSGYTDNVIAHRGVLDEGIAFIQKPFTIQSLTTKVREVLEQI